MSPNLFSINTALLINISKELANALKESGSVTKVVISDTSKASAAATDSVLELIKLLPHIVVPASDLIFKVMYVIIKLMGSPFIKRWVKVLTSSYENRYRQSAYKNYLISQLLVKKISSYTFTYLILSVGLVSYLIASIYFNLPNFILYVVIFSVFLTLINQLSLFYRIKSGLFGYNPAEAKELIAFIVDNYSDLDKGNFQSILIPEETILANIPEFNGALQRG